MTRRPKVLVVDDNEQNRALARMTLEDEGYEVILATGGEEALRRFDESPPDCVLLDVRMPGMDGHAVCRRIRAGRGGAEVPVVFLTAARDVDTFDRALESGGTDFLTKPVQPAELVLRVRQSLELRRLGAEVRAQYDLLRHQRDDLFRAQLLREDLAAFIVHDLKNPVSTIDLQAQIILRDRALSDRSRQAAEHVRAEVGDLLRLILNLLDVTRAEQGVLAPARARVDLRAMVAHTLEAREAQAREQSVSLRSELEAGAEALDADPDLLRRVLENLVENAIRHAPRGSTVRVTAARRGGAIELRVSDEGEGVPAEMRQSIFERYARLPGGVSTRTGRGLGLTFCKLAVEAHGGRVWVEDASPGAAFFVSIPQGAEG